VDPDQGEDRANPVLLFLHGSGMSMTPFTPVYREWEKHFTVPPPYPLARTWLIKQRWSFQTDPELRAWGKRSLRMVLTAPHMSLRDIWLFNTAFTFYPQPLYEETMRWSAWEAGTRFDVPFLIFQGDADEHTLTGLAREYFDAVEAPAKDLVLLPGGGHCAVLMQPDAFLAGLRARVCPRRDTTIAA
jgi:pimeloyl-ACP methyl ester carboxylesterase